MSGFLLGRLSLYCDPVARGGPAQMALDEALLECADEPVLRVYRWIEPSISFGYSQSLAAVRECHPGWPVVRRWTGGGIVAHDGDWTFSLAVPVGDPLAALRPLDTYRRIHEIIAGTLAGIARGARLTSPEECRRGEACFSSPALHDVALPGIGKICGGAQRRTRRGFLHQGSLQGVELPENFSRHLADRMAARVAPFVAANNLLQRAARIEDLRYGRLDWLERIP